MRSRFTTVIVVIGFTTSFSAFAQPDRQIGSEVLAHPDDEETVGRLIGAIGQSHDSTLIGVLRTVFERTTTKKVKQMTSLTLLEEGDRDERYLDELLRYAREAIESTAPMPFGSDERGNQTSSKVLPEFAEWCATARLLVEPCLKAYLDGAVDVAMLVMARDMRAIPLLRRGLSVQNHAIVQICVKGLASLNDTESISVIVKNMARFPPKQAQLIAIGLPDFRDSRIPSIIDQFVSDPRLREDLKSKNASRRGAGR